MQQIVSLCNEELVELPICRHLHMAGFCIKKQISELASVKLPSISTHSHHDEPTNLPAVSLLAHLKLTQVSLYKREAPTVST